MLQIFNKKNWSLRIQQIIIVILHLLLLQWIYFVLGQSGTLPTYEVLGHFIGMGLYGAALIRGCAAWGRWHYHKELKKENK